MKGNPLRNEIKRRARQLDPFNTNTLTLSSLLNPPTACLQSHTHQRQLPLPMRKAVYVAATRQHVGKSSVCLGMMSKLIPEFQANKVGFIKPVGQRHTTDELTGEQIDEDVHTVVDYFDMKPRPHLKAMSPIVIDRTYTRDLWQNGGLSDVQLLEKKKKYILDSYQSVCQEHDFTVVEGTGHAGVGSVIGLNNAQVAKLLNLDMIFIANGGLGKTYDDLILNMSLAKLEGANIGGVVINKVQTSKLNEVQSFFEPVLKHWNVPLVGMVPYGESLDSPTMRDYEGAWCLINLCSITEVWPQIYFLTSS